jgi:hypothetical protein
MGHRLLILDLCVNRTTRISIPLANAKVLETAHSMKHCLSAVAWWQIEAEDRESEQHENFHKRGLGHLEQCIGL